VPVDPAAPVAAVPVVPAVPAVPVVAPVAAVPVVPVIGVGDGVAVAPVDPAAPVAAVAPAVVGGTALVICPGAAVPTLPVVTFDNVNGSVVDEPPPTQPMSVIVCGDEVAAAADPVCAVGVVVLWPAKAAAAQASANPVSSGVLMNGSLMTHGQELQ